MQQQGATRPKDVAPPRRPRPKTLGTGGMVGKPWNYESPADYLLAYATRPAKTKAGKYLFDIFNTVTWMNDWYNGKKQKKVAEEQSKAINQGFEDALKNVNTWLDGIDPSTDIDRVPPSKLNDLYKHLGEKERELAVKAEQAKGKTDPESLRIRAEYKVYSDMFAKMDADVEKQRILRERARYEAESKRRQDEENARRKKELEEKARQRRERMNQDKDNDSE